MAQDVGTLYYKVMPSAKGFGKTVEAQAMPGVNAAGGNIAKVFSGKVGGSGVQASTVIGKAFGKVGKIGIGAITAIGGSIAGLAAKGGFDRALSIQGAQTKLKGLHHSAEDISSIMSSALESVKGTAYGLGDAATVAASLSASGVKSGAEMTHVLKSVADTAAISGKSLTDVGAIFGSVAARGKLQGDDMLQLTSAGVPVLDMLAKHLGTTTQAVSDMVSKGQIDFKTFSDAMEENMGGAALATGDTFKGAMANVKAALGRLGAAFELPIINSSPKLFQAVAQAVDQVTASVTPLANQLAAKIQPAFDTATQLVQKFTQGLQDGSISLDSIAKSAVSLASGFGVLAAIGPNVGALTSIVSALPNSIGPSFATVKTQVEGFAKTFKGGWKKVSDTTSTLGMYLSKSTREAMATEGDSIASGIVQLSKGLEKINEPFMNAAKKLSNTKLGTAIGSTKSNIVDGLENIAANIQNGAATLVGKANNALSPISGALSARFKTISTVFTNNPLVQRLGTFKTWVGDSFGQVFDGAFTVLQGVAPKLQTGFGKIGGVMSSLFGKIFNPAMLLKSFGFGAIAAGLIAGLGLIEQATGGQISRMIGTIGSKIPQIVQQINGFISQQLPTIIASGASLLSSIANVITIQAPQLIDALSNALTTAVSALAKQMPTLAPAIISAVATIIASIIEHIPDWIAAGSQLLLGLVQGIMNSIPDLMAVGGTMIQNLLSALQENLPTILQNGVQIIQAIVNGLVQSLPTLLSMAMQLIPQIGQALLNALPQIIDAGVQILVSLVNGIAQALPQLIAYAPIMIIQLASQLINNLPQIISSGAKIISSLISGITKMVPTLLGIIPGIVSKMISAFKDADWASIGHNIINGIVNGIKSLAGNIANAAKSAASAALDGVKSLLGIHSPSRVFRDQVGLMIGKGLAIGIVQSGSYVQDSMNRMADMVIGTTIQPPTISAIPRARRVNTDANNQYDGDNQFIDALMRKLDILIELLTAQSADDRPFTMRDFARLIRSVA